MFKLPAHTAAFPVIAPGFAGTDFRSRVFAALVPQLLEAVTEILPFVKPTLKLTVAEVVPCPAVTVAPVGAVQLYDMAFATAEIVYVALAIPAGHNPTVGPLMALGFAGVHGNTRN